MNNVIAFICLYLALGFFTRAWWKYLNELDERKKEAEQARKKDNAILRKLSRGYFRNLFEEMPEENDSYLFIDEYGNLVEVYYSKK